MYNFSHVYIMCSHAIFPSCTGPAHYCRRVLILHHYFQRRCLTANPSVLPERCMAKGGPMFSLTTVDFPISPTSLMSSCIIPKEDPSFAKASILPHRSMTLIHALRLTTTKRVIRNNYTVNCIFLTSNCLFPITCIACFKIIGLCSNL